MAIRLAFVHGSGYTSASFAQQVAAFQSATAIALPGHPFGQALESVDACVAWLAGQLAAPPGQGSVVVGNSLGGAIGLRYALDFPQHARGLVLIGSGARLRVAPHIFSLIENEWPACIPTLVDFALAPDAAVELRQRAAQQHEEVGQENTRRDYAACNSFDVMAELEALRVPVLIIVGSEDTMTPLKYSQYLHEHISGSKLVTVAGAGHLTMAEKPDEVNAAIREFLRDLE